MRASSTYVEKSINSIVNFLVKQTCARFKVSEDKALCKISETITYEMLMNTKTKLYAESPEYIFDMLLDELNK